MSTTTRPTHVQTANSFQNSAQQQSQPLKLQPHSITHSYLSNLITQFNPPNQITQRYRYWNFQFDIKKVLNKSIPQQFYYLSLQYIFLKKFTLLIKQFNQSHLIHLSHKLKQIYQILTLNGKVKNRKYDYITLTVIKLVGYFLVINMKNIVIDKDLQSELYMIFNYVLLGNQIGSKVYHVLIDKYKRKKTQIKVQFKRRSNKSSMLLDRSIIEKAIENKRLAEMKQLEKDKNKKVKFNSIDKHNISLFNPSIKNLQRRDQPKFKSIKQLLKSNLFVKQFQPPAQIKLKLNEVLIKINDNDSKLKQLNQMKKLQYQMKKNKMSYTQLSQSMDLKRNNQSLNMIRNQDHLINLKTQKQSKYYKTVNIKDICNNDNNSKVQDQNNNTNANANNNQLKLPKISNNHHTNHTNQLKRKDSQQSTQNQQLLQKQLLLNQKQQKSYKQLKKLKKQGIYWQKIIQKMKINKYDSIEQFPPVSTSKYFDGNQKQIFFNNNDQLNIKDTIFGIESLAMSMIQAANNNQNNGMNISNNNSGINICEFLTQKLQLMPTNRAQKSQKRLKQLFKDKQNLPPTTQVLKSKKTIKKSQNQSNTNTKPTSKKDINLVMFSVPNDKLIFKEQKGFENVYSNKPEETKRIVKRNVMEIKEIEKSFREECALREIMLSKIDQNKV